MNVGMIDRIVRLIIGIALIAIAYFMLTDVWMWVAYVVGAVIALTGLIGWCGLYTICGMNTGKTKSNA